MRRHPAILLLLATGPMAAAEKVTYDDQIQAVFQQSCLNCHNPDKAKGGLDLSSFSATMKGSSGGKIVEPGDTSSKLLGCVMQTSDKKMPPEGDKLGDDKISLIRAWIEGGLLENKNSSARKPTKPKFDATLSAAVGKPDGPPPMPQDVLLEPSVVAARASSVHAMVAAPWAPLLAITGQRQVILVDTNTLELAGILPFPEGDPISLNFTPNSRYLIVGGGIPGKSGITVTFDVVTGERMLTAAKEFDSILAADLTPDLSTVATGSPSRLVKFWKAEDGSQIRSIKKHTDWVTALDFSPDGILLASGDRGGGVWVWETGSGNEFQTLRAHQAEITAVSFRSDSNLLASASEDGTVRFWEMNGGTEVKKLDAHPGGVLSFAWFHDGSFITSGRDHAVRVWKPDFNLAREFKDQPDIQVAAACDFEGKRAFAADYRGQIVAWDLATGNVVGQFDANPPAIATRIEKLKQDLQQQPGKLAAAVKSSNEASEKFEQAKAAIAALDAGMAQAKTDLDTATRQNTEFTSKLEQLKQERPALEDSLAKARQQAATLEPQKNKAAEAIAAIDKKLADLSRETEAAAAQLQSSEQDLAKARSENQNDAIDGLEKTVASHRSRRDECNRNLEALKAEQTAAVQQLAQTETGLKAATEEVSRTTAALDASSKLLAQTEAARAAATSAITSSEAKMKTAGDALPAAREAVTPLEKVMGEAKASLDTEKQRVSLLEQKAHHWEAAAVNAEGLRAKAAADKENAELEGLTADVASLTKAMTDAHSSIASLREQIGTLEAKKAALSADPAALSECEASLASSHSALAKAEKDEASSATDLAAAKEKLAQAKPAAQFLKQQAEQLKSRYVSLRSAATTPANQ